MFSTLRTMSTEAKRCLLGEGMYGFTVGAWGIAFGFYLQKYGYSQASIGGLISVGYVFTAAASLLIGRLCQRVGFSRVLLAGGALMAAGLLLTTLGGRFWVLAVAQSLYGAGLACLSSMNLTLMVSLVPQDQSYTATSMMIVMYFSSSILGNLFAGQVSGWWPGLANPYKPVLLVCAAAILLQGLLRGTLRGKPLQEAQGSSLGAALRSRTIRSYLVFGLFFMCVFNLVMSMLALVLRGRYTAADGLVGGVQAAVSVLGCATAFILQPLLRRVQPHRLATACLVVQCAIVFAMAAAPLSLFVGLVGLRTMCNNALYVTADNAMLTSVPEATRGYYASLRTFANYVGMSIGAFIAGHFAAVGRYGLLFCTGGFFSALLLWWYWQMCLPTIRRRQLQNNTVESSNKIIDIEQ